MTEEKTGKAVVVVDEGLDKIRDYNAKPFVEVTPKTKVKKSPQGYDYVKGSYMDMKFKDHSPLYEYLSIDVTDVLPIGQIRAVVVLKNRVTGNVEVGGGGARIQVTKKARERLLAGTQSTILPFDIVDYDKNVKAAIENARKNAQRQFGICSDVYRRQEFSASAEEEMLFDSLMEQVSLKWRQYFTEKWQELGAGFEEFLESLEANLEKYKKKETNSNTNKEKGETVL